MNRARDCGSTIGREASGGLSQLVAGELAPREGTGRLRAALNQRVGPAVRCQAVTIAVDSVNETRPVRIGFDLLAQAGDGVVDAARVRQIRIAPHFSRQLVSMNDPLRAFG